MAALSADAGNFVWWRFVLQDVGLGFIYGSPAAGSRSLLMPRARRAGRPGAMSIPVHQESLFALGVAFATYGVTVLSPKGNGFIAVFVAAIVLGVRRPDVATHFERNSEEIVEIVKLGIFLVFGSLLTLHAFTREGWAALGFVAVDVLDRPSAGRVDRAARHAHRHRDAAVHGLVRAQGRRLDDIRADRPGPSASPAARASST